MAEIGIEEKLRDTIEWQLRLLMQKTRNHVEWSQFRHILENDLINPVISAFMEIVKETELDNKRFRSRHNQLRFGNTSVRDQRIIELHKKGLSRRKIGKEVQMSTWRVSKALRRLGVNSG
jgi:DNA-binding NarL/FixJ family response regulator